MISARDRLLAHLETSRPHVSLNAGLTSVAGACLQYHGLPPIGRTAVIFAVTVVGYLCSLYGTDFKDRAEDRVTRPQRPIPSGRIGEDEAVIWMAVCMASGLLGAAWLGFPAVLAACATMAVGVVRATTKSNGLVAPLTRSLGTAANLLFGAVAVSPAMTLPAITPAVWFGAVLFFIETFPKSVLGSLWDLEADKATGVRTPWVRYGVPRTRLLVLCTLGVMLVMVAAAPLLIGGDAGPYYLFAAAMVAMTAMATWRLLHIEGDRDAALASLNWLFRNRSAIVGAVVALQAGLVTALVIVVPVVVLAEWWRLALMAPRMYRLELAGPAAEG